jgi:fatty-acyl-CoA synthase
MVAAVEPNTVDPVALVEYVKARLAGYKRPRRVLVVQDLERSPTGKVDLAIARARTVAEGVNV